MKGTLLEEQIAFSSDSHLLSHGYFSNYVSITVGPCAANGINLAAIVLKQRKRYLKNKVLSPLYLAFYCMYLSETPHLSFTSHSLQLVLVRLQLVNNEGHFT